VKYCCDLVVTMQVAGVCSQISTPSRLIGPLS